MKGAWDGDRSLSWFVFELNLELVGADQFPSSSSLTDMFKSIRHLLLLTETFCPGLFLSLLILIRKWFTWFVDV